MLIQAFLWLLGEKHFGAVFSYQLRQSFFGPLLFHILLLKSGSSIFGCAVQLPMINAFFQFSLAN